MRLFRVRDLSVFDVFNFKKISGLFQEIMPLEATMKNALGGWMGVHLFTILSAFFTHVLVIAGSLRGDLGKLQGWVFQGYSKVISK